MTGTTSPSPATLDPCGDAQAVPLQVAAFVGALARSRFLDGRLKGADGRQMKVPQACSSSRLSYRSRLWTAEDVRAVREELEGFRRGRRRPATMAPRYSTTAHDLAGP